MRRERLSTIWSLKLGRALLVRITYLCGEDGVTTIERVEALGQ